MSEKNRPIRPTRIHKAARTSAERAVSALRELHAEDPYVFVALLQEILFEGYDKDGPMPTRLLMRYTRERADLMKLEAVHRSIGVPEERTKVALEERRAAFKAAHVAADERECAMTEAA